MSFQEKEWRRTKKKVKGKKNERKQGGKREKEQERKE